MIKLTLTDGLQILEYCVGFLAHVLQHLFEDGLGLAGGDQLHQDPLPDDSVQTIS
jgi:hypothetical protein